jgi:galactokinase
MTNAEQVIAAFRKEFSLNPRLFFSPGRINLIGEHIDYNDGFVMPAAIDKGIWFAIAPNNSEEIHCTSVDLNESFSILCNQIHKKESWKNYLLGVLHILQEKHFSFSGFDCVFGGNLPVGAGLSSSAAVEGGLIFALNALFEWNLDRVQMALLAQQAEHSYPGVNCGIMDMFASLNGRKDHVILLDCTSLNYQYFPLLLDEYHIVLINSKVHHSLASGEYNVRRKQCEEGLKILKENNSNIASFRNLSSKQLTEKKELLSEKIYDRCLFVTQEIERTKKAGEFLKENNLIEFGKLMFETHDGLSSLYEVSCAELDLLVQEAKKQEAVIGARLMGGGFGGCTINLIKKEKADACIESITSAYIEKFNVVPEVYIMHTENGTHEIVL